MTQALEKVYYIMTQLLGIMQDTYLIGLISLLDVFVGILAIKIIIKFFFKGDKNHEREY